jgi:hypothetical protein
MLLCQYHSQPGFHFWRGDEWDLQGLNEGNAMVSESQLTFLRSIDTPTVCNLIEIVALNGAARAIQRATCIARFLICRPWSALPRRRRSAPATQ